ncbi:YolD-like family protein [Sporolactobacillus terrae]|uniref:YolD-like family protein n=1 Tax=Sporolactobacillus terrae TaxID=269673 RepID=A0A410DA50_9BACL|nr:YolD-like family protein [Sporolactobacillus terrae]QAA22945.1 YolD-like family protein [Sporolactobacillus terrae]QAA25918.1 YolD-like family protein [Sporolactobacillus terrae]UAK17792.1 YolD-like family protein [Sporolactobacillus terrae]BBN99343.1 hypothetical protein St703_20480 [Sporolactobacillus terrae]
MKHNKLTKGSNMRWESSRMMLPEHVAVLREMARHADRIAKPQLDEQKLEEIERMIHDASSRKLPIDLDYYHDGKIHTLKNCTVSIDSYVQKVRISNSSGISQNLPPQTIVDVRFSSRQDV